MGNCSRKGICSNNAYIGPNIPTTSTKTIVALCHLHPLAEVDFPPFVDDFHPKTDFVLDTNAFIFALACSSRLSFMVLLVWCMNSYEIVLSLMTLLMV